MHTFFIVSLPVYSVAIVALLKIKSSYFEKYKLFLIWHTLINFSIEILNSWFLNPVVHSPLPILRFTGIFSQLGFTGLFQFFVIGTMIYQTAYSISEMFLFRFRASMIDYKSKVFYTYLRANIYIYRLTITCFLILNIGTYNIALDQQESNRQNMMRNYPDSAIEITCPNVIVAAPLGDLITFYNMLIWLIIVTITLTSTFATTIYLRKNLKKNSHLSATVVRTQKMLLFSLTVQTAIHCIMLGIPNAMFIVAAFVGVRSESEMLKCGKLNGKTENGSKGNSSTSTIFSVNKWRVAMILD
ncbi:hypothetical protein GCK72_017462 [Caenorhabditis remanei]|uniref:Uncharacterized protein n=1 Tax=Caenorhabditis remanei TaxID=31234 RepID=A0A6A5G851_CAERE|nr:hypothetical protein GCK72_017462 [Caenorhabditis remanei]KAF1750911.1 hypothetical protein GCK72_017462 [Caenorhabditis remanei]